MHTLPDNLFIVSMHIYSNYYIEFGLVLQIILTSDLEVPILYAVNRNRVIAYAINRHNLLVLYAD